MNEKQSQLIGECLTAAATGPFFPEWEFSTLFGLQRTEVADIAALWPDVNEADETVWLAINNAFANLLGYPIDKPQEWPHYLSVSPAELKVVFDRWRNSSGTISRG